MGSRSSVHGLVLVWHERRPWGPACQAGESKCVKTLPSSWRELQADQEEWLALAPAHVQLVYRQGQDKFVLQLLPILSLLCICQFSGLEDLASEPLWGFMLLGPLTPGAGWRLRQDAKYRRPVGPTESVAFNRAHVSAVAANLKVDEHTDTLRTEVLSEAAKGRFQGPWSLSQLRLSQSSKATKFEGATMKRCGPATLPPTRRLQT